MRGGDCSDRREPPLPAGAVEPDQRAAAATGGGLRSRPEPWIPTPRGQPANTSIAALRPLIPITLPPGCVPAPHRNTPDIGVRD
jgi:hypothetical protein